MLQLYNELDHCQACGDSDLQTVFNLGHQPLANDYKPKGSVHTFYPLILKSCRNCHHLQLGHAVDPKLLFTEYSYITGVNKPLLEFFYWFANFTLGQFSEKPTRVLDIGCNDGSQLDFYKSTHGLDTVGIDPATNLAPVSGAKHRIICDFYRPGLIAEKFDLIIVQNAFAHNHNQYEMLRGIKENLTDRGFCFIVTSQADMLLNGEFDTVYHEHISFYNINSMNELCKRVGIHLHDVFKHPIHGNSYIFKLSISPAKSNRVSGLIKDERSARQYDQATLDNFKYKAFDTVDNYKNYIYEQRKANKKIIGFGAPAKCTVFLNLSHVYPDVVIDETANKVNNLVPGTPVSIKDLTYLNEIKNIDQVVFVVYAWNYFDSIVKRLKELRKNSNDKFVRYFPEFAVI